MAVATDNVVSDKIPGGLFDQAYRIRAFVTVPEFGGWKPEDRIQILGLETGNPDDPFSEMPGIYLKANRLFGTHALTAGMAIQSSTRYCVETAIVINGADGSIDQRVLVDGVEIDAVFNADPNFDLPPFTRDPPTAALAGVSASANLSIVVFLGDPVWNTQPIGCAEPVQALGDPLYPGDPGYPFNPGDPFYGEPFWPPDTVPLYPGDAGYPYAPGDPLYGQVYYPPPTGGDAGSSGTVAVQISAPIDGLIVSDDPLLIEFETFDLSPHGGAPLIEFWVDNRRIGNAYGDPPLFFWEWFGEKPGPHQLRAVAKSTSGARVYSSPVTVYIPDIEQPDIAFLAPPAAGSVSGTIEVAVSAEDNVLVESVSFYLDGTRFLGTVDRPPYRVTLNTAPLTTGAHTLLARAVDSSGNIAEATRGFTVGSQSLAPWTYPTMAALPPPIRVQIDFVNDPFVSPVSTAILGSSPWAYLPLNSALPESDILMEDLSGLMHTGRLFGTWQAETGIGGAIRTTAMRTSGLIVPAPARRPSFTYSMFVKARDFGEAFPMRLLDTGGLRWNLGPDGSLYVEGGIGTGPNVVPVTSSKHVALIFFSDTASVGTVAAPVPPGPLSFMAILVDGETVAYKSPLSLADTLMMARSTGVEWVTGGGAGDLTIDEVAVWMRALQAEEIAAILSTKDNPPTGTDTWTEVTTDVLAIDSQRGRSGNSEHADVGEMIVELKNNQRKYEPENTASPYYPGITSSRKIRFQAFRNSVWKDVWRGYVENWPQVWGKRRATTLVRCVGNLVRFGHVDSVSGDFPAELTGARLDRILDAAGVPDAERVLDAGKLTLLAHRTERSDARSYVDQAVDSEYGLLLEDAAGRIAFHDRDHRATHARSIVSQYVLGDGGPSSGELPYVAADPDYDTLNVVNDVRVEWLRGVTQVAIDGESARKYGRNSLTVQTLLASELSAARLARTILDLGSQPRWRFPGITIEPKLLNQLWDVALNTEISDRLTIRRRPPGGGTMLELAVYVEHVRHSIRIGTDGLVASWETSFQTSTIARAKPVTTVPFKTISVTLGTMTSPTVGPTNAIASRVAPFIKTSRPKPPAAAATASYVGPVPRVAPVVPARNATASRTPPTIVIS